jgi:hypothetical protein
MNIPKLTSDQAYNDELRIDDELLARERIVKSDVTRLRLLIADGDSVEDQVATTEHILAGGSLSADSDLRVQLSHAMRNWQAIDDAKDVQALRIGKATGRCRNC